MFDFLNIIFVIRFSILKKCLKDIVYLNIYVFFMCTKCHSETNNYFFSKKLLAFKRRRKKNKKKLFVYCTLHNGFIQFPSVIFYLMLHVLFNYHIHTIHQRSLILMRP